MDNQDVVDEEPLEQEPEAEALTLWPGWSSAQQAIFVLLILGGAAAGAMLAWQHFGEKVADQPEYHLLAEQIEITPRPAWVRTDVKAEVVRDAGLTKLNLLSPQVTVQVAQAFATHSWVAEVRRVAKHFPAKVTVELIYRKPVAMVVVPMEDKKPGLLPVDTHGVLLPPADFSATEATNDFLRIAVGGSLPAGPIGTPWGDQKVIGAAAIASALSTRWKELFIYQINLASGSRSNFRDRPLYEILTAFRVPIEGKSKDGNGQKKEYETVAGPKILWGHAPGDELPQEATASQKIARLLQFVAEQGPEKLIEASGDIDVRDGQQIRLQARTARLQPAE